MQIVMGYVLIIVGLVLVVLSVLAWLGILKPKSPVLLAANPWDVLLAIVKKLPWVALVGLLLIYAGLKMIGVGLPL